MNKGKLKMHWLSVYLYHKQPFEMFLINVIKPFVKKTIKNKLAANYFYIRYWDDGPHIRLRFKCINDKKVSDLKENIKKYFNNYYLSNPESFNFNSFVTTSSHLKKRKPYRFKKYEPEIKRYGGKYGLLVAEEHFEYSSKVILNLIDESQPWDYSHSLGKAILLLAILIKSVISSNDQANKVIDYLFQLFLDTFYASIFKLNIPIDKNDFSNKYDKELLDIKKKLKPFILNVFENDLNDSLEGTLKVWYNSIISTDKKIKMLYKTGKLFSPFRKRDNKNQFETIYAIYSSYIHMTNNRLGVSNLDEVKNIYLLREIVKEL